MLRVLFFILFLPSLVFANESVEDQLVGVNAASLYKTCSMFYNQKTFVQSKENVARRNSCNGFFYGVGSTLLLLHHYKVNTGLCLPLDLSTEQVTGTFIEWSKNNPDKLEAIAIDATLNALRDKYPCK